MPSAGDSKKNNYVIQAKSFETGTTEDVLHWYITLQDILEKKSCDNVEAKFGMVERLLGCQGKKDFMRFKKTNKQQYSYPTKKERYKYDYRVLGQTDNN